MATWLEVKPNGRMSSRPWTNVWYALGPGEDYDGAQELVDYIALMYHTYWRPHAAILASINSWSARPLSPTGLPAVQMSASVGAFNGGSALEMLPRQIGVLVGFNSLTARPNRARKYVPGLTEGDWGGAAWSTQLMQSMTNLAIEWVELEANSDSRFKPLTLRINPVTGSLIGNQVTGYNVDPYPATQRRRR